MFWTIELLQPRNKCIKELSYSVNVAWNLNISMYLYQNKNDMKKQL